jgi:hypothetical protein
MKHVLRWISLVQVVGLACLVGGVIMIVHAFSFNALPRFCIVYGPGSVILARQPSCPSAISYVLPILLTGAGYVMFVGGFLVRFRALKRLRGTGMGFAGRRRRMPLPGMLGGMPFGTQGSPTGPPFGPPPGTLGTPFAPPLGPPPPPPPGTPFGPPP